MKMHLQANKGLNGQAIYSVCASRSSGMGKVVQNHRDTYRNIDRDYIVRMKEFLSLPSDVRCSHCMDRALDVMNRRRKREGLSPVQNVFDGIYRNQINFREGKNVFS